jgi:hypothetical protein
MINGVIEYLNRQFMWHLDSNPPPRTSVLALGWVDILGMVLAGRCGGCDNSAKSRKLHIPNNFLPNNIV